EAYEYGRRYILAPEGTTAENLLQVKMTNVFSGEPMIGFTPRGTNRIKIQGGGSNFVHGGISLQEMVVPVIKFNNKTRSSNRDFVETELAKIQLLTDKRRISNLMFTLDFYQPVPAGEKILPAVYKVYLEDENGNKVSDVKEVVADFDSPNTIDRQVKVRFNLKPDQYDKYKTYKLIASNGRDVPLEENFTIDIAMADDFGFDF
ncbi:MAG: BREX-1 system phosphatase PglZ type A, partial [Erysipelotrichaceae bacterium]|nr:BREX-1 system phosphatase PglZ type A [Erysipelotrichaceae bacterium]